MFFHIQTVDSVRVQLQKKEIFLWRRKHFVSASIIILGLEAIFLGCVNDANDWKSALEKRGFAVDLLLDAQATKKNMSDQIRILVKEARPKDVVVITYSGHGSWIPDLDNDEPDARDEVLCPYDIGQNRPLSDDELHTTFAERASGVRIVLISDSCHSGSIIRMAPPPAEATGLQIRFLAPESFLPPDSLQIAAARATRRPIGMPRTFGGVMLSGCQDTEYSYDASFNNRPNGAFSYFALKSLQSLSAGATYKDWHKTIRESLPNRLHPQTPNLLGTRAQKAWKLFE